MAGHELPSSVHGAQGRFEQQAVIISDLVITMALYGVDTALVSGKSVLALKSSVLRLLWGTTGPGRTTEIIFVVLTPGHNVSACLRLLYLRVLWLARICTYPGHSVAGGATCMGGVPDAPSFPPTEGWWTWNVPGQDTPLAFFVLS